MTKSEYIEHKELLASLPIFYQPWYLDLFDHNWDLVSLEAENEQWIFPYFSFQKWGFKLCRPPALTPYYGPIKLANESQAIWAENVVMSPSIEASFKKFSTEFSMQVICPYYTYSVPQWGSATKLLSRVTHTLDLNENLETLLANMNRMRRKNINKAERELVIVADEFDVESYFEWINKTFEKRGSKQLLSKAFLKQYVRTLAEHGAAILHTAYDLLGNKVAMSLIVIDNRSAYSILGANNPQLKHSAATTMLLWKSIQVAKAKGCTIFDFEGSSIPEIANFFKQFGATRREYEALEITNSLSWKIKKSIFG